MVTWSNTARLCQNERRRALKTTDGIAGVGNLHLVWVRDPDNNVLAIHD